MFHIWWKTFAFVALLEPLAILLGPLTSRLKAIFNSLEISLMSKLERILSLLQLSTKPNYPTSSRWRESGHERTLMCPAFCRMLALLMQ